MENDINSKLSVELFERKIDMELPHPTEDHFFGLLVSGEFQRRVFFDEFVQAETDLVDIRLRLGLDRIRQNWFRQTKSRIANGIPLMGQRVTGVRVFEFCHRHNVSSLGGINRHMPLPQDSVEMAKFLSYVL